MIDTIRDVHLTPEFIRGEVFVGLTLRDALELRDGFTWAIGLPRLRYDNQSWHASSLGKHGLHLWPERGEADEPTVVQDLSAVYVETAWPFPDLSNHVEMHWKRRTEKLPFDVVAEARRFKAAMEQCNYRPVPEELPKPARFKIAMLAPRGCKVCGEMAVVADQLCVLHFQQREAAVGRDKEHLKRVRQFLRRRKKEQRRTTKRKGQANGNG